MVCYGLKLGASGDEGDKTTEPRRGPLDID